MPKNGQIIKPLFVEGNEKNCWEWQGSISKNTGYGKKQWYGKTISAHKWIFEQRVRKLDKNEVINHLCMNKKCVNPKHLEATTTQGNIRYSRLVTKLLDYEVKEIKNAKSFLKWGQKKILANLYGVSPATISDIWYGRSWRT